MAHVGWIIDLGPGADHDGGPESCFEVTPADLVAARSTLTGSTSRPTSAPKRALADTGLVDLSDGGTEWPAVTHPEESSSVGHRG